MIEHIVCFIIANLAEIRYVQLDIDRSIGDYQEFLSAKVCIIVCFKSITFPFIISLEWNFYKVSLWFRHGHSFSNQWYKQNQTNCLIFIFRCGIYIIHYV